MPIVIPPSVAYQGPLFPIAGRWNNPPPEGDKFIPIEIDWGVSVPVGQSVQISLSNGPVAFTQVVAVSVDNGRNGADVSFIFPDTGRQLTVPAYAQGVYPLFTNALTFYVISESAGIGDISEFEILNSMPPPVSVLPSQAQSRASSPGIELSVNGPTQVVAPGTTGTLQGFQVTLTLRNLDAADHSAIVVLQDGNGQILWDTILIAQHGTSETTSLSLSNLRLRFQNGLVFVVQNSTIPLGNSFITLNVYFSVP
jgi:hypothetical protein